MTAIVLGCVLATDGTWAADRFLSHPPMRELPSPADAGRVSEPAYFVDPVRGDDVGAGSELDPWRTIRRGVRDLEPGETLYLRGGTYYERLSLKLRGTSAAPIVLRAYPGELAILDGGLREFFDAPGDAWEPFEGGAPGEFRSVRSYRGLGGASGYFGDSMVPLHSYLTPADLRAINEHWAGRDKPMYCGPGVWLDPRTRRMHVRLAPVRLGVLPAAHRYRGVDDPRKVPMVLTGGNSVTLRVEDSAHVAVRDLVVRGGGQSAVEVVDSRHIVLDGLTAYSGYHALRLESTEHVRVLRSRFRGAAAPWSSRARMKYKGEPGVLIRTAGLVRKNRHLEIAYSEFTDGHDGVFLGDAREVDFHHNLVENFNDDGIFLTARGAPNGPLRIFANRISRTLTSFAFGWGRGQPNIAGNGVFIYRNIVELMQPVYMRMPEATELQTLDFYGGFNRDHGSPVWEPAAIYHNTFVAREVETRYGYLFGWGSHLHDTWRRVFNNMFLQVTGEPDLLIVPTATVDLESDGNLFWSLESLSRDPLERFRQSADFRSSRERYPPGWEASSLFADPRLERFAGEGANDYRPTVTSPAVDRGLELPPDWPRVKAIVDLGRPDIGALPLNGEPLDVGPDAVSRVSPAVSGAAS